MSRNLLPRFRDKPNPANVEALSPGRWTQLQNPVELAKLELPAENADLRTRIQSIPSPWARMHLFRNALEDPQHPAHRLVQNELLDALEFIWSQGGARGAHVTVERVRLDDLRALAQDTGSMRVEDFADALVELSPRRAGGGQSAVPTLSLLLVNGTPIAASSPYTVLFTGEDAGRGEATRGLFRYAAGAEHRPLSARPFQFQRYVAQVLVPQLQAAAPSAGDEYVAWNTVQACVTAWLNREIRDARAGRSDRARDQLSPTPDADGWRTAAASLHLEPIGPAFGGVVLYTRVGGHDDSRWRLRTAMGAQPAPIVVDPASFDGRFYEGAPPVKLPADLSRLDRNVLPGVDRHHPWVCPQTDWLTDQVFLLGEPLRAEAVKGLRGYRVQSQGGDPRFAQPRLALPLRSEFFRFFSPDDVDRLLTVEVLSNGSVAVSLTVPVGSDDEPGEVVVRRVYPDTHILKQYGPELSVWPAFEHAQWSEYTVFRTDREQFVAEHVEVRAFSGGQALPSAGDGRRTPLVRAAAFAARPEILEFRSTASGRDRAEPLGVVLPRYPRAADPHEMQWAVGVDFGTSNTIVSVLRGQESTPDIFSAADLVLPVTEEGAETRDFLAGYFFPPAVPAEAFGTAVVHIAGLPQLELEREATGVRVNVPFSGMVRNDGTHNRVKGDLKWSEDREEYFLSSAFLRHVMATVAAEGLRRGVKPKNINVTYSYPRSFSQSQVRRLEAQWRDVQQTFQARGLGEISIRRGDDESRSVLRYFFNIAAAGSLGAGDVIIDVGGGTSDLAAYGDGRTLLLDSVLLGGKNLTGPRQHAAGTDEAANPFVTAFVRWAQANDLPTGQREVLEKYLGDGEIHLAFTYLVRTPWFSSGQASRFWATPEFRSFQAMIFYFFAALFYYTGLAFRSLPSAEGTKGPRVPQSVTLAGNGSQYLLWLSEMQRGSPDDSYRRALSDILRQAAGAAAGERVLVEVTTRPKEEVARGLVMPVKNASLTFEPLASGPVIGERVTVQLRAEEDPREMDPGTRLDSADTISPDRLGTLRWPDGELEGERFHASLLRAAEGLVRMGGTWAELPDRYRSVFSAMGRAGLRNATAKKLEYLANKQGAYGGSIFILEATVVLERMLDEFFGGRR